MFTIYKKSIEWGGKPLTLETGRLARQADGAVLATYGETKVLATVVFEKQPKAGFDFFPLTCLFQDRFYAGGRIPGGFLKREGRPSERETLTSRLMDRPIRPLFVKGFKHDTQVVATVLQMDGENDADIVALVAASAALAISGAPFLGPIAAARVGFINNELVLNPTTSERAKSDLDLVVAGTAEGVLMVESEAQELPEDVMLEAVMFGHERSQKVIKAITELAEAAAKPPFAYAAPEKDAALEKALDKELSAGIVAAYKIQQKQERRKALDILKDEALQSHAGPVETRKAEDADKIAKLIKGMEADVLRRDVLKNQTRLDGRKPADIRPIVCEIDVLPRTHGSALFTRGETQALVVATLGTGEDEQLIDIPGGQYDERFMLHYNFPPFSVGETGRMGAPGRREIGHGKLAWRAIKPLLPGKDVFPYTVRVVSEILESNGSSSMATVCGTSMALMAAGCPLPRPIAGIAMGLVKEGKDYVVLSDIMGDEDHLGDMDFKVAGSANGLTALQMDIKITSITKEIMAQALQQAQAGRLHILAKMEKAIDVARGEISDFAPGMQSLQIHKDDIRVLIGKGGETIRGICERFNCTVDVDDDGKVVVASVERPMVDAAVAFISNLFAKPELGQLYPGKVVTTTDFGAFVSFMGGKEGLVHVSEVVTVRLGHITDALQVDDQVTVKVVDLDDRGKIRLTVKNIPQAGVVAERIEAIMAGGGAQPKPREDGEQRGNRDDKPRHEGPRDGGERKHGRDGGRGGERGHGGGGRGPRREGGDRPHGGGRDEKKERPRRDTFPAEEGGESRPKRVEE